MIHHPLVSHGSGTIMKMPLNGKNTPRKSHFKCAVVGDKECGKTSLLRSYTTKLAFPYTVKSSRPLPSQYPVRQSIMGCQFTATITDTDSESIDNRTIAYSRADVVILCFSLVDKSSFKNLRDKWFKEIVKHCPNTPVVLVGTHSDLVHSPDVKKKDVVTLNHIQKLLDTQRIHGYCESSALTKDGLSTVFGEMLKAAWIGPVRYVTRMRTVRETAISKLRDILLHCAFSRTK